MSSNNTPLMAIIGLSMAMALFAATRDRDQYAVDQAASTPKSAQAGTAAVATRTQQQEPEDSGALPADSGPTQGETSTPSAPAAAASPDQQATTANAAADNEHDAAGTAGESAQPNQQNAGQVGDTASSMGGEAQAEQGTVEKVWEEVKEAGQETAEIFTGQDTAEAAASEQSEQGPVGEVWEEVKEAGEEVGDVFVGEESQDDAQTAAGNQ